MSPDEVLVVDDDPASGSYLTLSLEGAGYATRLVTSGPEALLAMRRHRPRALITDLQMPGMSGLELLGHAVLHFPDLPVILVTVEGNVATIVDALRLGAVNYLVKPVSQQVLLQAIARALETTSKRNAPRAAESAEIPEIVGESAAIERVRELITLAARSDFNVVTVGETGTGKELVARAIHRLSALAQGPFVAHNCALTPAELFESEFFGHLRGAFTGASRDHTGLLERAHRGSLFLDELECLSLPHQAKLLRVLDDGLIRQVGAENARDIAVRFLAATNKSPEDMLARGELRHDLFYRLGSFEILLPPLRQRGQDVLLLARHFLSGTGKALTTTAAAALLRYPWPGNVRQLKNLLYRIATTSTGPLIEGHDLGLDSLSCSEPPQSWGTPPEPFASSPQGSHLSGTIALETMEREAIRQALVAHDGNRGRTAQALGIHRTTLRRKLKQLGLKPGSGNRQ